MKAMSIERKDTYDNDYTGEVSFWCKRSIYQILARYLDLSLSDFLAIFYTKPRSSEDLPLKCSIVWKHKVLLPICQVMPGHF